MDVLFLIFYFLACFSASMIRGTLPEWGAGLLTVCVVFGQTGDLYLNLGLGKGKTRRGGDFGISWRGTERLQGGLQTGGLL